MSENTIEIVRRDDAVIALTFTDENGDAINLSGSTVFFTVKESLEDTDDEAIIEKEVSVHSDPTAGETEITLDTTDTNVEPGTYFYDLQLKNSGNKIVSTIYDKLRIIQDVTIRTS